MSEDLSLSPQDLIREHVGLPYVDGASDTVIEVRLLLDSEERAQLRRLINGGAVAARLFALRDSAELGRVALYVELQLALAEKQAQVKS